MKRWRKRRRKRGRKRRRRCHCIVTVEGFLFLPEINTLPAKGENSTKTVGSPALTLSKQ